MKNKYFHLCLPQVCDIFAKSEYGDRVNKEITRQLDPNRQDANAITFDEKKLSRTYKASWVEQFKALICRGFLSSIKEPMLVKMRIVEFIVSYFQTKYQDTV